MRTRRVTCHARVVEGTDTTTGAGKAPSTAMTPMVPDGFLFGVATAAFQIEGGMNGPGEPANNWAEWEADGKVEPSGIALDFWNDYEPLLDRASALGCTSFRLSIDWARCEPSYGEIDEKAFERYRRILDACRARGLVPLVTLHHFTHPAWLGTSFWIEDGAPERFSRWVANVMERLGDRCQHWVTVNELNILAIQSWMTGDYPPGRRFDHHNAVRALDHLAAAHVKAYDIVHSHRPDAVVGTNNYCLTPYELDHMVTDVFLARKYGVDRRDLTEWLATRRDMHRAALPVPGRRRTRIAEAALARLTSRLVPLDAFRCAADAVYDAATDRTIDVVQLDFYAPIAAAHFRLPGHRTAGGRSMLPVRELWDDGPDPAGLAAFCRAYAEPGLDVWIVENGLCTRVRNGRSYPRHDGWDRVRYIEENLAAMAQVIAEGVPVTGYWHWTLADNYEWGSYEPRCGLYAVDRERGIVLAEHDALGHDAAGAYRRAIERLRSPGAGNRSGRAFPGAAPGRA